MRGPWPLCGRLLLLPAGRGDGAQGYLIFKTGLQPFTHSLVELVEKAGQQSLTPLPDAEDLRWLQEHYLQARYPNARLSAYTREEALKALEVSRKVVEVVRSKLRG